MRKCTENEITIEKLLNIVHNYTDPIRIEVIMGDAWLTCNEAKHMHDFVLTERYRCQDKEEQERLLKYYKDVPVWNLTVWHDAYYTEKGRTFYAGIEARCYYKDLREGWLAEKADKKRQQKKEYRRKKKNERNERSYRQMGGD